MYYISLSSNSSHRSGYLSFTASSIRDDASLLILNSGLVFFRSLKTAADLADHNEIRGFFLTSRITFSTRV